MDEESMAGRPFWAWFRYRVEEGRAAPLIKANIPANNDLPDVDAAPFPSSIYERSWGSIPLVYYFDDCHQLPPVGMKYMSDLQTIPKIHTSNSQGLLSIKDFLSSTQSGTRLCTVVMNTIIRQRDPLLKSVLNNIRSGTMDEASVGFLLRRCLDNLSEDEKLLFKGRHCT